MTILLAVALVFNLPAVLQRAVPDYTAALQSKVGGEEQLQKLNLGGLVNAQVSLPGNVTMWDWEAFPVLDAQGRPGHLLIMAVDVTERHLAVEKAREAAGSKSAESRGRASGRLAVGHAADARAVHPSSRA